MATQSANSRWFIQGLPKDSFSVFSLLNERNSNGSSSPISEEVQNSFRSFSLNQSPSSPTTTTKKPYLCKECGQIFSRPHNLKSHLTTHSSLRPYKCGICSHHFRRHHDLKRHQKLHTGEKPYSCSNCNRAFARLDALNRHQRSEGLSTCTTAHYRKNSASDKNASPHASDGRPIIPHIKITNRASQPHPTHSPRTPPPILDSTSPASGSSPSPPPTRLGSSSSAFVTPIKELSPFSRSPTWSPPGPSPLHPSRTLPLPKELASPSVSSQYEKLELENKALKQEINMMFHGQLDDLRARVYDLEIENRVLRSLIGDQKSLVKSINDIDLELKEQKEKIFGLH